MALLAPWGNGGVSVLRVVSEGDEIVIWWYYRGIGGEIRYKASNILELFANFVIGLICNIVIKLMCNPT